MIITNNSAILSNNYKSAHKIACFVKISKPRKLYKSRDRMQSKLRILKKRIGKNRVIRITQVDKEN